MFTGSYFAKTFFAGTYWTPADGGLIITSAPQRTLLGVGT